MHAVVSASCPAYTMLPMQRRLPWRHTSPSTHSPCTHNLHKRDHYSASHAHKRSLSLNATSGDEAVSTTTRPKGVVVGGGWAGLGAAYSMLKAGMDVTLLDAAANPGGLSSSWKTSTGRQVEPGIKGFWYQYANIFKLVEDLGISSPFTAWTESSFYSPQGLQVRAPIFQNQPRLPTPLGSFIYTNPFFTNLPVADRLTALPLVQAMLEYNLDEETYSAYDRMSARELFRQAGVSQRLYKEFLEPMLLVTLFAPGEKLSAAAALDALYFFVLQHQECFDVRWCRGAVADRILRPFVAEIERLGGTVLGGRRVKEVLASEGTRPDRVVVSADDGALEVWQADAIVFAVGVSAIQGIVAASPVLAAEPQFAAFNNLSSVDVMAARLWLDKKVQLATASNVLVGFDEGVGGTLFDLNVLQDEYKQEPGSVLELDFYHAGSLLPLSNEALHQRALSTYLPACNSAFSSCRVEDSSILRFRNAVTAFLPGSHQHMPEVKSNLPGVFLCGDWVRQGPGMPQGLSQEKAYVTGIQAGNLAAEHCRLAPALQVVRVAPDEPHVATAKELLQQAKNVPLLKSLRGAGGCMR